MTNAADACLSGSGCPVRRPLAARLLARLVGTARQRPATLSIASLPPNLRRDLGLADHVQGERSGGRAFEWPVR